jgi:hypothetical protein
MYMYITCTCTLHVHVNVYVHMYKCTTCSTHTCSARIQCTCIHVPAHASGKTILMYMCTMNICVHPPLPTSLGHWERPVHRWLLLDWCDHTANLDLEARGETLHCKGSMYVYSTCTCNTVWYSATCSSSNWFKRAMSMYMYLLRWPHTRQHVAPNSINTHETELLSCAKHVA